MDDPFTNQEIYEIIANDATRFRDLKAYLSSLLGIARQRKDAESLTVREFLQMLADALVAKTVPYDPAWAVAFERDPTELTGFEALETKLLRQIVDLDDMKREGERSEHISPRGTYWYNIDTGSYLESAAAREFAGPTVLVEGVSWDLFARFLRHGP